MVRTQDRYIHQPCVSGWIHLSREAGNAMSVQTFRWTPLWWRVPSYRNPRCDLRTFQSLWLMWWRRVQACCARGRSVWRGIPCHMPLFQVSTAVIRPPWLSQWASSHSSCLLGMIWWTLLSVGFHPATSTGLHPWVKVHYFEFSPSATSIPLLYWPDY